jgi:hypothetical protein
MKRILTIAIVSVLVAVIFQMLSIYRILSASSYQFFNLENIQQLFNSSDGDKNISMRLDNPTNRSMYIKDVSIEFNKAGRTMGGFKPLDLRVTPGTNNITLTFLNTTKYGLIATDYILNGLSEYKLIIRGNWLGIIPFRYKLKMSNVIS